MGEMVVFSVLLILGLFLLFNGQKSLKKFKKHQEHKPIKPNNKNKQHHDLKN